MILDRFRLDGKTALVTGCRRGIGRALAVALAEAGADIIGVSASLVRRRRKPVARQVRQRDGGFTGYACDFTDRKACTPGSRGESGVRRRSTFSSTMPGSFFASRPPSIRTSTGTRSSR